MAGIGALTDPADPLSDSVSPAAARDPSARDPSTRDPS